MLVHRLSVHFVTALFSDQCGAMTCPRKKHRSTSLLVEIYLAPVMTHKRGAGSQSVKLCGFCCVAAW